MKVVTVSIPVAYTHSVTMPDDYTGDQLLAALDEEVPKYVQCRVLDVADYQIVEEESA